MVSRRSDRRGFALAATVVCLPVMIAAVGLVVDAGRMMAVKDALKRTRRAGAGPAGLHSVRLFQ